MDFEIRGQAVQEVEVWDAEMVVADDNLSTTTFGWAHNAHFSGGTLSPTIFSHDGNDYELAVLAVPKSGQNDQLLAFKTVRDGDADHLAQMKLRVTKDTKTGIYQLSSATRSTGSTGFFGSVTAYAWTGISHSDLGTSDGDSLDVQLLRTNQPATGDPSISGTLQLGETLTAHVTDIADEDGLNNVTYSYRWIRVDGSDETEIDGATSNSYVPTADDIGKRLRVQADFQDDLGFVESLHSEASGRILQGPIVGCPAEDADCSGPGPANVGAIPAPGFMRVFWMSPPGPSSSATRRAARSTSTRFTAPLTAPTTSC